MENHTRCDSDRSIVLPESPFMIIEDSAAASAACAQQDWVLPWSLTEDTFPSAFRL